MRFRLPEASVLRDLDHTAIDEIIDDRIESRRDAEERWTRVGRTAGRTAIAATIPVLKATKWREISDDMRENIHSVAEFLISARAPYKLVISVDIVWVYTNSLTMLDELRHYPVYAKKYSEAIVDKPKNTVVLREPKHTHRSYFKNTKLARNERDILVRFLLNHQDEIRLSPALLDWITNNFHRTYDYFFIDHNGPYWLTMLGLVRPGLIKKTYDIISAK